MECSMSSDMDNTNKVVVVSGATSGIGLHTALAFARLGVCVIAVGRARERCAQAEKTIRSMVPQANVHYLIADLSLMSQVRQLAKDIRNQVAAAGFNKLDLLINNAGIFSETFVKTPDGLESTMAVNHFAPFLLTHELLPLLMASPSGRVITISSGSHYRTVMDVKRLNKPLIYNGLWAYKVSKLANVLFTREFNRRMVDSAVHAFAVDPGLVKTEIGTKGTTGIARWIWQMRSKSGVHPDVPVQTILHLSNEDLIYTEEDIYWFDSKPISPGRQAQRDDLARELWDYSCQICGIVT